MKSPILMFLMLLVLGGLQAQHETLFNKARVIGAFGAPITEFGLRNDINFSTGGGGGLIINSFFIGGYGLASIDYQELFDNGEVEVLDIGHGGFWLGSTFQPWRLVHAYGSARLGWGAINVDLIDTPQYRDLDKIFVATPEIGLELNITQWCRLSGTVGYRFVSGSNEARGYTDADFSGAVSAVTVRLGWFGRRRNY